MSDRSDPATGDPLARFLGEDGVLLSGETQPGRYDRVGVRVADRLVLRSYAGPAGVRSPAVAVLVAEATSALALVPRPEWPPLVSLRSRRTPAGSLVVARFARPVAVADVVAELGRQAVWPDRVGNRGLFVSHDGAVPDDVPPDVVLGEAAATEAAEHPVTGRAPLVLADVGGPCALGPLDERVLNPIGFDPRGSGPVTDLAALDLRAGPTEELVRSLRPVLGVTVALAEDADPVTLRTVAGLAMAGVPLTTAALPRRLADQLGAPVAAALTAQADLGDPLAREEHSLVLRRAALDTFSSWGWARAVGERAGVRVAAQPAVSVVLATRRPEQLEFALEQVARQRGVDRLELVLAPHGFKPDPAAMQRAVGDRFPVQVVPRPETVAFGDVLAAAAAVADGDVVLKMDDDDWYSPDAIADLLRARGYSGAELVGMPAEFHYLTAVDVTVKRGHPSELYARFVAGGTMLVDRALLREVGSFRSVRKYVDASLLAAVTAAGGEVYRTHGLGYLLRRNESGHTWQVHLDYLLDPSRVERTWPGFAPSRLMGVPGGSA